MKTRLKGYSDYGFAPGEEKKLKEYCKNPEFLDDILLLECAKKSNPVIYRELYFSIVKGVSYDQLDKKIYLDYGKSDFYGYQRKTIALFRNALRKVEDIHHEAEPKKESKDMNQKKTPLKAIRAKCLQCACDQLKEVRDCPVKNCALFPFRMGHKPRGVEIIE